MPPLRQADFIDNFEQKCQVTADTEPAELRVAPGCVLGQLFADLAALEFHVRELHRLLIDSNLEEAKLHAVDALHIVDDIFKEDEEEEPDHQ